MRPHDCKTPARAQAPHAHPGADRTATGSAAPPGAAWRSDSGSGAARTRGADHPRRSLAALTLLLALAAAGMPASADLREAFIDPTVTGPGIEPLTELPGAGTRRLDHFIAVDADQQNGFLFVFLAGSGGLPENYQVLARHAATRGFNVVSLAYPNWPSVRELTGDSGDPDSPGAVREERLFGTEVSPLVDVDQANSVINRLVRLLQHLDMTHPEENWARFLVGVQPRWAAIMLGGHSQGAGHGAYLAQEFRLASVLMFGGPGDFVNGEGPADWLFRPLQTAPGRLYGFVHELDFGFSAFQLSQSILGLCEFGPVQDVDTVPPAAWFSRRLTSTRLDVPEDNFHGAVAVDHALPLDGDGDTGYLDAWNYMLDSLLFTDSFEADGSTPPGRRITDTPVVQGGD